MWILVGAHEEVAFFEVTILVFTLYLMSRLINFSAAF